MNQNTIKLLEYDKIKQELMQYAITDKGRKQIVGLEPSIDLIQINRWMNETTEARQIIEKSSSIPLHSLSGIEGILSKLGKATVLHPEELSAIALLLEDSIKIKKFMINMESIAPIVSSYALSIYELSEIADEIYSCIISEQVYDRATNQLFKVRKKILVVEDKIRNKLDSLLKTNGNYMQDAFISTRGGRHVIPVKKEYRKNIDGNVLDTSGSGSTVFVEPTAVKKLQDELSMLKLAEEKEVYKVLSHLTALVDNHSREISINVETIAHYDFLFSKAKYSKAIQGNEVSLNSDNKIILKNAKHPLIGKDAVPLEFNIGYNYKALLITGPNTGGKTVVLKTVGLLTMMAQSGLHVPAELGSELSIYRDILVDIGDGQSIEQSLSTFSSHIKNISSIIECSDPYTLVIMDELGAGTDPGEGMGLATAILEFVYSKGATIIATTHYSELKDFAENTKDFENGSMDFDIETLKPMYRLNIGKAGESNAFLIALRLGVDKKIIERAHIITYRQEKKYDNYVPNKNDNTAKDFKKAAVEEIQKLKQNKLINLAEKEKSRTKVEKQLMESDFKIGDCVFVSTMNRTGIVCEMENGKGEVGIIIMKKKFKINKKRLKIYIEKKEMYPADYDYDVILESKENRKKKKIMQKRHDESIAIEYNE